MSSVSIRDFRNPFSFHFLLSQPDRELYPWLETHRLVASSLICETCRRPCKVIKTPGRKGGKLFRCRGTVTWKHENNYSCHKFSFFEGIRLNVREILVFTREWLLRSSLKRCATESQTICIALSMHL